MTNNTFDLNAAIDAIVDGSDETYLSAEKGDKARIVANMKNRTFDAVRSGDMALAQRYMDATDRIVTATKNATESVDYVALVARRIVTLRYAAATLADRPDVAGNVPDETDFSTLSDVVDALIESVKSGETDISDDVASIVTKAVGRTQLRRSPINHINTVMSDIPVGSSLKLSMVRNTRTDAYGDDRPSAGLLGQTWDSVLNGTRSDNVGWIPTKDANGTRTFTSVETD